MTDETPIYYHSGVPGDAFSELTKSHFVILDPDRRELIRINRDGTVTGEVEDASEAAHVFFAELRRLMGRWEK